MKYPLLMFALFTAIVTSAQERGVAPVTNPQSKIRNPQSTYALVVGISDYQDEQIPDLKYADRDAEAFANFLRSPAGGSLDGDHLKMLTNELATAAQISIELDWLMEVASEGDRVFIYFSGHGDVEAKRLSQPGYLLGWDAPSKVYMAGGAINVRDLQDIVSTLSVENKAKVFLITDACHSGKLSGSDINGAQLTSQNLARQYANEIKILSCQPNEYSIEGEQWGGGRGAFSYYLIDGLYGMADGNVDQSVNLMELGRYLQDKVTTEVAPQSQVPMTVGNFTEKLVDVFPEILAQIKERKKGQLQLFTATESRGIEEDVLAKADSGIVKMYAAFKQAIKDKQFLEPANACADFYYEILSKEPQLERLHASMRRNYAAALQDDAQQLVNLMLKGGFTEKTLKGTTDSYMNYPEYLEKAAGLLGPDHYMYPILLARKYFLMGYLAKKAPEKKEAYQKALELQPDMPLAHAYIIYNYVGNLDSALYHFNQATELVPNWNYPYIILGFYYFLRKEFDKSEETFKQGIALNANNQLVKYFLAKTYHMQKKYELEEPLLKDVLASISPGVCFPCATQQLSEVYNNTGRTNEARKLLEDLAQTDPSLENLIPLGWFYLKNDMYEEAEQPFLKAISLDSLHARYAHANLGLIYAKTGRYEEADRFLKKALLLEPDNVKAIYMNYAILYSRQNQVDKAFEYVEKAFQEGYDYSGQLHLDVEQEPFLQPLRAQTARWRALVEKYYPGQVKD
ncbi:MAG: tetratricopeptide repeat protein [Lewinellaceae bacterium]|nr:tetratricopeptide repeat protein [Saprospiraceae bacterium]MCB9331729.1 tetratricopeptide repeat protein [Lewinellaceae bacterium]